MWTLYEVVNLLEATTPAKKRYCNVWQGSSYGSYYHFFLLPASRMSVADVEYTSEQFIFKVRLSPSPPKLCYLVEWKPFKNDEKCFLFHLKSSFRF